MNKKQPSKLALHKAAQAWGQESTKGIVMDPTLALEFARILDRYIHALQIERNRHPKPISAPARNGKATPFAVEQLRGEIKRAYALTEEELSDAIVEDRIILTEDTLKVLPKEQSK